MKTQEAIKILEGLAVPIHAEAAFDMAISALQAQEELYVDSKCKTCRYYHDYDDVRCMICDDENDMYEKQEVKNSKESSSTHKALDTISRQAAIDALGKRPMVWTDDDQYVLGERNQYDIDRLAIETLPSAQPEPQWIPVSERLPEDGTDCLVSVRCPVQAVVVDMATYSTDLFTVDKEDFFGNRGESGWYYFSREYGYCKILNVIAWMPLPEPYSTERRNDE